MCKACSLGGQLWLHFKVALFSFFFQFLHFDQYLSLKSLLINHWRAVLISYKKHHLSFIVMMANLGYILSLLVPLARKAILGMSYPHRRKSGFWGVFCFVSF